MRSISWLSFIIVTVLNGFTLHTAQAPAYPESIRPIPFPNSFFMFNDIPALPVRSLARGEFFSLWKFQQIPPYLRAIKDQIERPMVGTKLMSGEYVFEYIFAPNTSTNEVIIFKIDTNGKFQLDTYLSANSSVPVAVFPVKMSDGLYLFVANDDNTLDIFMHNENGWYPKMAFTYGTMPSIRYNDPSFFERGNYLISPLSLAVAQNNHDVEIFIADARSGIVSVFRLSNNEKLVAQQTMALPLFNPMGTDIHYDLRIITHKNVRYILAVGGNISSRRGFVSLWKLNSGGEYEIVLQDYIEGHVPHSSLLVTTSEGAYIYVTAMNSNKIRTYKFNDDNSLTMLTSTVLVKRDRSALYPISVKTVRYRGQHYLVALSWSEREPSTFYLSVYYIGAQGQLELVFPPVALPLQVQFKDFLIMNTPTQLEVQEAVDETRSGLPEEMSRLISEFVTRERE